MNKLRACPFCGLAPRELSRTAAPDMPYSFVHFISCYCGGYSATAYQHGTGKTREEAEQDAARKWNRRAGDHAQEGGK